MSRTASVKLARILSWIIAGILFLLPFHALLTTWLGSNTGHLDLVRIWKDILIVLMLPFGLWLVFSNRQLKQWFMNSWIVQLFIIYVLLHLALGLRAHSHHQVNSTALIYALIINLRFIYFFVLCAAAAAYSGFLKNNWAKIVLWPASIVVVFGLLQRFLLPYDFLKHFGYNQNTIPAYQTVDSNIDYRRVQSTLRGANPLGAYLVLVIPAMLAASNRRRGLKIGYLAAALVVMFYSYSRSAWIGLLVALGLMALWRFRKNINAKWAVITVLAVLVIGLVAVVAARSNQTAQDTLFHTSSASKSATSSNEARTTAIANGAKDVAHQPLGRGPGTAGPASFRNTGHQPRIAEDYYLQIGQEVGVLGMAIFAAINILVGYQLWLRRKEVLAQVLLASLVGISFINLVSHAWADDTLSLLWWGLAGIALAPVILTDRHNQKDAQKIKKTA